VNYSSVDFTSHSTQKESFRGMTGHCLGYAFEHRFRDTTTFPVYVIACQ